MKIRLGVFFGGKSVESDISVISALQTIDAIDKNKYEVIPIYISKTGVWFTGEKLLEIENYKNIDKLLRNCNKIIVSLNSEENVVFNYPNKNPFKKNIFNEIDIAFPILHGTHGEDGCIQGIFEIMNIPFVGCNVLSSALGMEKVYQKIIFQNANLPILDYYWFYSKEWIDNDEKIMKKIENELQYPMIIKPANLGSSIGIAKINNHDELVENIEEVIKLSEKIILEKAITNLMEINCSVLGDFEEMKVSECEQPITSSEVLSFQEKYLSKNNQKGMESLKRRLPADIPLAMKTEIQKMAKLAFKSLGCSGVSRVDFLIDKNTNKIYVNEINTIPGSLSFYLWEATEMPFGKLIDEVITLALKNHREKNNLNFSFKSNVFSQKGLKNSKK